MPHVSALLTRSKTQINQNSGSIKLNDLTCGQMLAVLNALGLRSTCSVVCREIYDQVRAEIEAKWPEAARNHTDPDTTDLIITERARNRPADDAEGLPDMTETPESATPTQAPLEPGSRHVFKNNPGDDDGFSGFRAAESFLTARGYSFGSMCRDSPIGVMFGNYEIAKWRNLTSYEQRQLHGEIRPLKDFRGGGAEIVMN